jgi:hypothetical protein
MIQADFSISILFFTSLLNTFYYFKIEICRCKEFNRIGMEEHFLAAEFRFMTTQSCP